MGDAAEMLQSWALSPEAAQALAAEAAAQAVLEETGRALGATPFCRDAGFARAAADLPVFIRQSHGDRDDAALARAILTMEESPWDL